MRRGGRSPSSLSSAAPPGGRVLLLFSSFQPSPNSLCGPGAWIRRGQQEHSPSPPTTASKPLLLTPRLLWDAARQVSTFPKSLHFPAIACRCDACRGLGAFPLDGVRAKTETSAALPGERERNSGLLEGAEGLQVGSCMRGTPCPKYK